MLDGGLGSILHVRPRWQCRYFPSYLPLCEGNFTLRTSYYNVYQWLLKDKVWITFLNSDLYPPSPWYTWLSLYSTVYHAPKESSRGP